MIVAAQCRAALHATLAGHGIGFISADDSGATGTDSNLRPAHYERAALPTELRRPENGRGGWIRTNDPPLPKRMLYP